MSNILTVLQTRSWFKKKNGKWRVCIDFTDLNKACLKDSFPLPHIDRLVEATAGHELLSFMDAFSGYNQILMNPEDREKMSFITERGTYCYKVMPFGLKKAGATYQRLVNKMFSKQLGETMEVYIDDMLVKSSRANDHVPQLQECFNIVNKFGMKLNPTKCTFGVASREFLGYLVTERGIKANLKPIAALVDTLPPRSIQEVQLLTGKIAALNRFISRSTDRCLLFYKLLKGNKKFEWNIECDSALKELKAYISEPTVLSKPIVEEILFLYVATSEYAVCEQIYYVSRSFVDAETRYLVMEKLALAVVTAARKLRPYLQSHSITVMTLQPLRTILHSPSQSGRLAKWAIELSEYDIEYKPRTSSKAQVLADFFIELVPKGESSSLNTKRRLHVDGASSKQGSRIGIQLESPTGEMIEQSFQLGFNASNNEAEYESVIAGLRLARSVGAQEISAFSDSQLVTNQFHGEYEAKNERMEAYLSLLQEIAQQFDKFALMKIPRGDNTSDDALAALASTSNPAIKRIIPVEGIDKPSINLSRKEIYLPGNNSPNINAITTRGMAQRESQCLDDENNDELDNQSAPSTSRVGTRRTAATSATPKEAVHETSNEAHEAFKKEMGVRPDWRIPIYKYIKDGELPSERWEARKIKARSSRYCIMEERLYRRSQDEPYLLGVSPKDAFTILKQTHGGACGSHSGGRSLAIRIKKLGYFWPTIADDREQFPLKCDKCQRYVPMIHQPTQKLSTISSPYPFMK
ncbi:PREDICTED: uncharacterized protein LOC106323971 [Brassica oleracea var. oleracea]|uniref:uncharacterized protein LOC106323971 n=1 Tax=Brassica oleracea var. oleracea TaxID=109376 RepID=UPI0006A6ADF4|nr:PREDICTED: uncharacterized protein LOC106323971 [Brassica oleracea var. oleracea]